MKRENVRHATWTALAAVWVLVAGDARAVEQWRPTDLEMTMLPPYCRVRFEADSRSPEYKEWQRRLGPDFLHVHHFCAGLNFLTRSYKPQSKADRDYNLQNAETNFTYVIHAVKPTFVLMPEAYLDRGIVRSMKKNAIEAVPDITRALEMNPHLVRGYLALGTIYANAGDRSQALSAVSTGLRYNPDSKILQARYEKLGGKLPYPEPIQRAQADPAQELTDPGASSSGREAGQPPASAATPSAAKSPKQSARH